MFEINAVFSQFVMGNLMTHPLYVVDTVYTRFNVEALKCLANVLISKVYLPDATSHSEVITCTCTIVTNFGIFEPRTLFRASFLCKFAPGDNFATTMSVQ